MMFLKNKTFQHVVIIIIEFIMIFLALWYDQLWSERLIKAWMIFLALVALFLFSENIGNLLKKTNYLVILSPPMVIRYIHNSQNRYFCRGRLVGDLYCIPDLCVRGRIHRG
jgi:hypothetical protein